MAHPCNLADSGQFAVGGENCLVTRNCHDLNHTKATVAASTVWLQGRPVDISAAGVATALTGPAFTVTGQIGLAKCDVNTTGAPGPTEFNFITRGAYVNAKLIADALGVALPLPAALVTALNAAHIFVDTNVIA